VQTYFRFTIFDAATRALMQRTALAMLPALQHRDGPKIALIQAADSVTAVLDLLPLATGIAETIWDQRMRRFGLISCVSPPPCTLQLTLFKPESVWYGRCSSGSYPTLA
jgi:hypothetical protein